MAAASSFRFACPSFNQQCDAGEPPQRPAQLTSLWQRLLYGEDIVGLVHILGFTRAAIEGKMQ